MHSDSHSTDEIWRHIKAGVHYTASVLLQVFH